MLPVGRGGVGRDQPLPVCLPHRSTPPLGLDGGGSATQQYLLKKVDEDYCDAWGDARGIPRLKGALAVTQRSPDPAALSGSLQGWRTREPRDDAARRTQRDSAVQRHGDS